MVHQVVEMVMVMGTGMGMEMVHQAPKEQQAQNQMNGFHATVQTVHPMQINQLVRK